METDATSPRPEGDRAPEPVGESGMALADQWFGALGSHPRLLAAVLDTSLHVVAATPAAQVRFPWVMGRASLADHVFPDDWTLITQGIDQLRELPVGNIDLRLRVADDEWQWFEISVLPLRGATAGTPGPVARYLAVATDIGWRLEAEQRLATSERRLRVMLQNVGDVVTIVDDEGRVLMASGQLKEILGYPTDHWLGHSVFEMAHPDELEAVREVFDRILAHPGQETIHEFMARHADGRFEHVEITGVNLLDDPAIEGVVLATRNITARKENALSVARARDEALRALQQKSEFVASVSHELRNPINGILGLTELLLDSPMPTEAQELAASIGQATRTLTLVLDDLLDFSRIEAGRLELVLQPFRPAEVVMSSVDLVRREAAAKQLELDISIDPELPPWASGDPIRIGQVLTNLVGNAVKFTPRGSVTITAGATEADGQVTLRFTVTDTGIGIGPDNRDRLFEPFSQASASTALEYGGTGLGLSISQRLVDLMGGTLGVDSDEGLGSRFWFEVPVERTEAPEEADTPGPVAAPTPLPRFRGRILVVEDNPVNQLLVTRQLQRLGCEVLVHETGRKAIASLRTERFDAVLMDWQLPDLDGIDTTARIRTSERRAGNRHLPIIAMTATAHDGARQRCLDAGMDDFMAKPTSLERLAKALAPWLERADDTKEVPTVTADDTDHVDLAAPTDASTSSPATRSPTAEAEGEAVGEEVVVGSALATLCDEVGDERFVLKLIGTYLNELPRRLGALEGSVASGDRGALSAAAHSLASPSAMFGAVGLSDRCRRVELDAIETDRDLADAVAAIGQAAAAVEAALRRHVDAGRLVL